MHDNSLLTKTLSRDFNVKLVVINPSDEIETQLRYKLAVVFVMTLNQHAARAGALRRRPHRRSPGATMAR
jgi:hypothetical protein